MPSPDMVDPRTLGLRIAEARKARGLTQQDVAEVLGCSRPTYIAIEKGDRRPRSTEIVKLASYLGRTINELVRPTEPVVGLSPHLRAAADKAKAKDREGLATAVEELRRLAEDYRDLERLVNAPQRTNYPTEVKLAPKSDPVGLAESVAVQERRRLGLGDQPVIDLRKLLTWEVGVRIFYLTLPSSIAGLYAYAAEAGCCIAVNRKHPPERRRVTMVHEYGHFIADRYEAGIDYLASTGRRSPSERFAEAFAVAFLMPESSVRQRFHDIVTASGDFQLADLCRLCHFYFVSVQAMTLRLEQLSLIPRGSWQSIHDSGFTPRKAVAKLDLGEHPVSSDIYPERYRDLAVHAYSRGEIGISDLSDYLRCDIVDAREIVEQVVSTHSDVDPTGEWVQLHLDFDRSLLGGSP